MKLLTFISVAVLLASPSFAASYDVDYASSKIAAKGEHAGTPFEAVFEEWSAEIDFDVTNLEASQITARFNPASIKTGNKMYDGTLPQVDWFNVKSFPEAVYKSTSITHLADAVYKTEGELTIRDITLPLSFEFTLSDLAVSPVSVKAEFPIDRLAYGMGKGSDPKAEWVSQNISVVLDISANPK